MSGFDKIVIPMAEGNSFILSTAGQEVALDDSGTVTGHGLPTGWKGELSDKAIPPIQLNKNDGLRLVETMPYEWAYETTSTKAGLSIESPLDQQRSWVVRKRKGRPPEGSFQIINYLGNTYLKFTTDEDSEVIELEFISKKLDFDEEYRRMTEDIADYCEQLLLSINTPTSLRFTVEPTEQKQVIIESFFFLRHFLNEDSLAILLEHIRRNPHRTLQSEREWRPIGRVTSADHLINPNEMLREWQLRGGHKRPSQGLQVTRTDTFDTPVNQFVLFALRQFRRLVEEVLSHDKRISDSIRREALGMAELLDASISQPFFRGITTLQKLPLNNQTLQKREGYRDILKAWILVESASSLSWEGRNDCYEGNTRDVATLYEYWLFMELHKLIEDITGVTRLDTEDKDNFIQTSDGEITVHLKRGRHSSTKFIYEPTKGKSLHITLHYELTFNMGSEATSGQSYSRQFKPDYTLSIYSTDFKNETEATKKGGVRHLHFDAKYRVNNSSVIFGKNLPEGELEKAINQEKAEEKASSSYKRGDLLKMHTYNDALRKTIGSYVLYPGDDSEGQVFRKFNELAPGVGAYVMKPGRDDCADGLRSFINDVLTHQSSQFTQYSYMDEAGHQTYSEEPQPLVEEESSTFYNVARPSAKCVMLWIPKGKMEVYRDNGFAYCHAIYEGRKSSVDLDLSTEIGSEFIPIEDTNRNLAGWRAKITAARFISHEKLDGFYKKKTGKQRKSKRNASHYILYEFDKIEEIPVRKTSKLHAELCSGGIKYMAVTTTWEKVLECEIL